MGITTPERIREFEVRSPITGRAIATYPETGSRDIPRAMGNARAAFAQWQNTSVAERMNYLSALRRVIVARRQEIADAIAASTGKVAIEPLASDIYPTLSLIRYYENNAEKILAARRVRTPSFFRNAYSYTQYRPLGVTLVIAPWNYPFQLALVPAVSALVAGNAVLLKPSELTLNVGELITRLVKEAGFPEHLVQTVYGGAEAGRELIDAKPDMIFFTGGTATGRQVMAQAARDVIPLVLELGSKDPMIVFDDAPFERAVNAAVYGAFSNSGQTCVSIERLYVQDTLYEKFLSALVNKTKELRVGTGRDADIGAIISPEQMKRIDEQLSDAFRKGAQMLTGVTRQDSFLSPVILKDVNHSMAVMREETFGPVLPVMPFSTMDEAIGLANDTPYGLNASVWTCDLEKGKQAARRIAAGNCVINDVVKNIANPYLPFGGVKQSGFGRYHGPQGLYAFSRQMSVMVNSGETERDINWFPYSNELYQSLSLFISIVFGDLPLRRKLKGLLDALRHFNKRERLW